MKGNRWLLVVALLIGMMMGAASLGKKWEYKVIRTDSVSEFSQDKDINAEAANGWEVVCSCVSTGGLGDKVFYCLRREK